VPTNETLRSPLFGPLSQVEPTRRVTAEGIRWRVFELSDHVQLHARRSLIFEQELAWQRVRRSHANWCALVDDALIALSGAT
jgi:hypothetical protein